MKPRIQIIFALILAIVLSISVNAESTKVSNYLQDNANLFNSEQKQLIEQSLREFEAQTSVQFVIFTTDKIPEDTSLEEYSLKIAEDNKIGKAGLDTGLLFFIAVNDKKYRWEVGYGLEDVLNTAWLGRNSRDNMVPYFKQNMYAEGILAGMKGVMQKVLNTDEGDILPSGINARKPSNSTTFLRLIPIIFFLIIILTSIFSRKKGSHAHGMLPAYFYLGAASGMFSGRGGLGGGFGGLGGGFGGGGFGGGW